MKGAVIETQSGVPKLSRPKPTHAEVFVLKQMTGTYVLEAESLEAVRAVHRSVIRRLYYSLHDLHADGRNVLPERFIDLFRREATHFGDANARGGSLPTT